MTAKRIKNGVPLGIVRTEVHTNVPGWTVQGPIWAGESMERVPSPDELVLDRHELGWTIRLGGKALVSLNDEDLVTLGVALIRADARMSKPARIRKLSVGPFMVSAGLRKDGGRSVALQSDYRAGGPVVVALTTPGPIVVVFHRPTLDAYAAQLEQESQA